jgi:hypothetical protein
MYEGFFKKVTKRQMSADTFSEEYIFFSNFKKAMFLLGTGLKKQWVNHPTAIQKRVKQFRAADPAPPPLPPPPTGLSRGWGKSVFFNSIAAALVQA